eukprot:scaffold1698_cov33-Tisochrysis_lutea.AAC.3
MATSTIKCNALSPMMCVKYRVRPPRTHASLGSINALGPFVRIRLHTPRFHTHVDTHCAKLRL